jgi:N-acetylmuramoyl-L-alanine amidase
MNRIYGIIFGVLLITMGSIKHVSGNEVDLKGHKYILLKKVAEKYGMAYDFKDKKVVLSDKDSKLEFTLGSRWGTIKGTNVALIYPVEFSINPKDKTPADPRIDTMDLDLTLEPLLNPAIIKKHKLKRIMIDPGHGGKETGCLNKRYIEKNLNLIYAEKLCKELRKSGYEVEVTRTDDKYIGLKERADITAQKHADIFISLHINALSPFESKAEGIENYCMTPAGGCSTNSGEVYGYQHSKESYPGNEHNLNNIVLTYCIHKAMIEATGAPDRSVRRANFSVLRNNSVPAVLVESGYLTNAKEEKLLVSDKYQDKIVKAIAKGIQDYDKLLKLN